MKFEQFFAYISLMIGFLFCLYANYFWASSEHLRVSFLDVGQGDSILIQTPHGHTVLIDGGPGISLIERLGAETSFWMKDLDLLVLTHPHRDHLEGFLEILPRYHIKKILLTGIADDSILYKTFLSMIEQQQIPTFIASPDQDCQIDEGIYLDIIAPVSAVGFEEFDNINNSSIVARLVYKESSLLLTGDSETEEENAILLSDSDLRSQFLKSGHHGSRTSSGLNFLRSVQAKNAVMMNGKENQFSHPHLETILRYDELGIEWRNTKDEGTMTFVSDGVEWVRETP